MSMWKVQATVGASAPLAPEPPQYMGGGYGQAAYALLAYLSPNPVQPYSSAQPSNGKIFALGMAMYADQSRDGPSSASTAYFSRQQFINVAVIASNPADFDAQNLDLAGLFTPADEIDANDGGAAFNGGLLSITFDQPAGTITAIGPLGSQVFGGISTSPVQRLVPFGLAIHFTPPAHWSFDSGTGMYFLDGLDPTAVALNTQWSNFYGQQDGMIYTGAALTAADPGIWLPWDEGTASGFLTFAAAQQLSDYAASLTWDPITHAGAGGGLDNWTRRWNGPAAHLPMTDLTRMKEHALLFGAWVNPSTPDVITVRRSDSDGHSWSDFTAVSGTDPIGSPSVATWAGLVYLLAADQTSGAILQTRSADAGLTWSTPVPISLTGGRPRLVIADDGPFFYFTSTANQVLLQRSFDLGATLADLAPITVATATMLMDYSAVMNSDRQLVVGYIDSGAWATVKSSDYGRTWAPA